MTVAPKTETQRLLDALGWSRSHAASQVGVSASTMQDWASGRNARGNPCQAPDDVLAWLRECVEAVWGVPVPMRG